MVSEKKDLEKLRKGSDEVPKVFLTQKKFILIIFWAILDHANDFFVVRFRKVQGLARLRASRPSIVKTCFVFQPFL